METRKAIKNISSTLLLQIVTVICGFIVPKLIISTYGSTTNGLIVSITQFLAYITLLEAGLGPVIRAALYKPLINKNKIEIKKILNSANRYFKKVSYIFILYIIILIFLYPNYINNSYDNTLTVMLIIVISISTFAEYFFGITYRIFLQADQKTYVISNIQTATTILNTILIITLIKFGFSIVLIKLFSSLIFVLRPILQNIYVQKKYCIKLNKEDGFAEIKNKKDGLAQHIAFIIHSNTDTFVLTIFTTMKEVSVYSIYLLVINGIRTLMVSFISGMEATFGKIIASGKKEKLNLVFEKYEVFYYIIVSIVYSCLIALYIPFIKIYTYGINDVNYIRPTFAIVFAISELLYSIRQPYNILVFSAGKIKETKKGSWLEAIINISISIIFVFKYGIIGVAIGTLTAMFFRTTQLIIYAKKNILKSSISETIKKIILSLIIIATSSVVFNMLDISISNYFIFFIFAIIIGFGSLIMTISLYSIFFKNIILDLFKEKVLKNIFKKKKA